MTLMAVLITLIATGVAVYAVVFVYANRHARVQTGRIAQPSAFSDLPDATSSISVLTWNIGYAALGKDADLIVDKGRSFRALSANEIDAAAHNIADWLAANARDVICLQENATAGFLTRDVPLRSIIADALPAQPHLFWSDMKSAFVPRFLHIDHGMSVHARLSCSGGDADVLSQDGTHILGLLRKRYGALTSRYEISDAGQEWVIFNIHLIAYDAEGHARRHQLEKLMRRAHLEYKKGNFVIIAGDWNMRLTPTEFKSRTEPKDLPWATDFPREVLPENWRLVVDKKTPTVRSLETDYRPGANYTTIVDGFVTSPNVALKQVLTDDQGFRLSDHHPVKAEFVARL